MLQQEKLQASFKDKVVRQIYSIVTADKLRKDVERK